jgi:hypothetical protein
MAKFTLQGVEVKHAKVKEVRDLGTVVECKVVFKKNAQDHGVLSMLEDTIGQGPSFQVGFAPTQIDMNDPA